MGKCWVNLDDVLVTPHIIVIKYIARSNIKNGCFIIAFQFEGINYS